MEQVVKFSGLAAWSCRVVMDVESLCKPVVQRRMQSKITGMPFDFKKKTLRRTLTNSFHIATTCSDTNLLFPDSYLQRKGKELVEGRGC